MSQYLSILRREVSGGAGLVQLHPGLFKDAADALHPGGSFVSGTERGTDVVHVQGHLYLLPQVWLREKRVTDMAAHGAQQHVRRTCHTERDPAKAKVTILPQELDEAPVLLPQENLVKRSTDVSLTPHSVGAEVHQYRGKATQQVLSRLQILVQAPSSGIRSRSVEDDPHLVVSDDSPMRQVEGGICII